MSNATKGTTGAAAGRRGLAAAAIWAAALLAPGPAGAAPQPGAAGLAQADAQLLGLLATVTEAWRTHERELWEKEDALQAGDRDGAAALEAAADESWRRWEAGVAAMAAIAADGLPGLAAKAAVSDLFREFTQSGLNAEEAELLLSTAVDATRLLKGLGLELPPADPAASADADLIDLADRWDDLAEEFHMSDDTARQEAAREELHQVLSGISGKPAFTREGREAKADILLSYVEGRDDPVGRLSASLAQDVLRRSLA